MRITGAGHAGEPGAPAGRPLRRGAGRRGRALPARRRRSDQRRRRRRHRRDAGHRDQRRDPRRPDARSRSRPGPSPAPRTSCAVLGLPRLGGGRRGDQRLVFNVIVPAQPHRGAAGRWRRGSTRRSSPENLEPERGGGIFSPRPARLRLIRLAVRCRPEQAELVLAELTVLAPNGVEEERGPRLRRVRDLRRRGRAARRRASSRPRPARGWSRSAPPRSPTTGPTAGRTSTSRCWSAAGSGSVPPGRRHARRDRRRRRSRPRLRNRRPPDHPPLPRAPALARA